MFDRFKRGVDVAKFKADQLLRVNRVQNEIGGLRREIQNVREQIAGAVIDLHKQTALSHAGLDELCVQIDRFEAQIGDKEKQIESIRAEQPPQEIMTPSPEPIVAKNPCPNCHFDVPEGAAFCPECGHAMPAAQQVVETEALAAVEAGSSASKCTNCGFALPADAEFCPECGTRVGAVDVDASG